MCKGQKISRHKSSVQTHQHAGLRSASFTHSLYVLVWTLASLNNGAITFRIYNMKLIHLEMPGALSTTLAAFDFFAARELMKSGISFETEFFKKDVAFVFHDAC
jgi:hypothetical protein